MWFHGPFGAGRSLTRGMIFQPDGTLVTSVVQEGWLRQRKEKPG
jgi:acyl-CoA thioesterase-2